MYVLDCWSLGSRISTGLLDRKYYDSQKLEEFYGVEYIKEECDPSAFYYFVDADLCYYGPYLADFLEQNINPVYVEPFRDKLLSLSNEEFVTHPELFDVIDYGSPLIFLFRAYSVYGGYEDDRFFYHYLIGVYVERCSLDDSTINEIVRVLL